MHRPKHTRPALLCALILALGACVRTPPPPLAPAAAVELNVPAPDRSTLLLPVAGVHPHQLRDSFDDARPGGRRHWAIDIHAPRGTPVMAVRDGTILKLHQGNAGGIAIYQLDLDGRTRYYYAHLDRYTAGLVEGQSVFRGEVIGYVGDTGNAAPGNYHLHFSIAILDDVRRWWEGTNLNPYPILKSAPALR
jgi:peptidoglycan LD-endopeptidase LytH